MNMGAYKKGNKVYDLDPNKNDRRFGELLIFLLILIGIVVGLILFPPP